MSGVEGAEREDHDEREAGVEQTHLPRRARRFTKEERGWFDMRLRACRIDTQVFRMRRLSGCRDELSPLAIVAELADAHGSGPCTGNGVGVRVPSMAPENQWSVISCQ